MVIRVVADSSCDLPRHLVVTHDIEIVPLTIRFGDREYVDGVDLTGPAFWQELRTSSTLPETAAPSAGRFRETFERIAASGADGIVAVCISGDLSATYQAAVIAAEQTSALPVTVIDSRNVSMAMGFQVLEAARAADRGAGLEEVSNAAVEARERTNLLAALDTLEYLKRGGRVGNTQAFFGELLHVKPLITVEDGVVAAAGRVRTRSKAVAAVVNRAIELAPAIEELAILDAGSPDLDALREQLGRSVPANLVATIGPVVGTHTGPGVIGVAYRLR